MARQKTLDEVLDEARRKGIPVVPPRPDLPDSRDIVAVCGACGLELRRTMGYVCPRANCPCFSRPTC